MPLIDLGRSIQHCIAFGLLAMRLPLPCKKHLAPDLGLAHFTRHCKHSCQDTLRLLWWISRQLAHDVTHIVLFSSITQRRTYLSTILRAPQANYWVLCLLNMAKEVQTSPQLSKQVKPLC